MQLRFESGKVIDNARASDIRKNLEGEEFTILISDEDALTFIQCAEDDDEPGHYIVEYQEGSTYDHYRTDEVMPLERVLAAFYKYLRGDESWRTDFEWEHMPL
jgi:hypothetical protein